MLVLSRKKNETIVIDGGIEVEILQTKGGTVKVGIKAPESVRIVRGELELHPEELDANGFPDDFPNDEDFDSMFPKSRLLGYA